MKLSVESQSHSQSCGSTHIFIKTLVDTEDGQRGVLFTVCFLRKFILLESYDYGKISPFKR